MSEWPIEYGACSRCGATIITTHHWMTNSNIEINPLPHPEGHVLPDFQTGKSKVIPIKQMKNYPELWLPHVATCPALRSD